MKSVVEVCEEFRCFDVGGVFGVGDDGAVAGDEAEGAEVFVQVLEGKLDGGVFIAIVQGDAGEVRDDDVARNFLASVFVDEIDDVLTGLGLGF